MNSSALLPQEVAQELSDDARLIAAANLRMARECGELAADFERATIPLLFVKGLALAALVYRTPMLKVGWDIDVLINLTDLPAAAALLEVRGYSLHMQSDPVDLLRWHSRRKESVWSHPDGFYIELHTRLADSLHLIQGISILSPSQSVEVTSGVQLTTLARDELFAYLCVHGASSAWFRLKWITDVAAFLAPFNGSTIEHLYSRSQELGAYRAASQALLLADALYGSLEYTDLKIRLSVDRSNRLLAAAALRQLTGSSTPREPTSTRFGTARIHWTQLLLKPGLAYKINELHRQISDAIT